MVLPLTETKTFRLKYQGQGSTALFAITEEKDVHGTMTIHQAHWKSCPHEGIGNSQQRVTSGQG